MLKLAPRSILKSVHVLVVLSLLLPLAHGLAGASPSGSSSASFKGGFSSQRSSSSSPSKGSFGSFGKRSSSSSSPSSSAQPGESKARSGGFGSFGRAAPSDARRSDSALSQKLDRDAAAARALRTLDERRAAQAARNAPRRDDNMRRDDDARRADNLPPPGYGYGSGNGNGGGYGNGQAPGYGRMPPSDNGLGRVIAGAVIANAAANAAAHAANNHRGSSGNGGNGGEVQPVPMPAPTWNGGVDSVNAQATPPGSTGVQPAKARGGSVFGTVVVLLVLVLMGWIAYKWIMRARARRDAGKPNYSFERN